LEFFLVGGGVVPVILSPNVIPSPPYLYTKFKNVKKIQCWNFPNRRFKCGDNLAEKLQDHFI